MRKRRSATACHSIGRVVPPETPGKGATRATLLSGSPRAPDSKNGGDALAVDGYGRVGGSGAKKAPRNRPRPQRGGGGRADQKSTPQPRRRKKKNPSPG